MKFAVLHRIGRAPVIEGQAVPVAQQPEPRVEVVPPAAGPGSCKASTKAGKPCSGRAGADGYCAAHKEQ